MIEKAKMLDDKNEYFCHDLIKWIPKEKVDIVHSMEVFYYFEKPEILISRIYDNWLKNEGRLIMGIDHYLENKPSHSWKEDISITTMQLLSENTWLNFFKSAGFSNVEYWCFGKKGKWNGTLIISGIK